MTVRITYDSLSRFDRVFHVPFTILSNTLDYIVIAIINVTDTAGAEGVAGGRQIFFTEYYGVSPVRIAIATASVREEAPNLDNILLT